MNTVFVVKNQNHVLAYKGEYDFPIFDIPQLEGDLFLADSRFHSSIAKIPHEELLLTIADCCNIPEIKDASFAMVEAEYLKLLCIYTIARLHTNPRDNKGYVYIIKDNLSGYCKIGRTKNIDKRFNFLKTSNTHLQIYGYKLCNNCVKVENILHKYFQNKKVKGEWFDISPEEASQILSCHYNKY